MNTRTLLVSVLMLVSVLLSACQTQATPPAPTSVPPTAVPTAISSTAIPARPLSDPKALATVAGNYSYKVVGKSFNFILNTDGSYTSIASFGIFTVTADQIIFIQSGGNCASQPGVYKWLLTNNVLKFTPINDDCQQRATVFGSQTFEKDQALLPSDPNSLALIAGAYTYQDGSETFQFNLFSNESFINLRESSDGRIVGSGAISVTGDQIMFLDYGGSCEPQPGVYKWTLENTILHLALIKDDCKGRADILGTKAFEKVPYDNTSVAVVWETPASVNGIAADSLGNIYITDGIASFLKYDANGKLLGSWSSGLSYTTGIAVDHDGSVYVANFNPPEIHKFLPDGTPLLTWTIADGVGPVGLAVDLQGNVYVALHRLHDHYIEKYDPQGKLLDTWAKPATAGGQIVADPRTGPSFMAAAASGENYIQDNEQAYKYDQAGNFLYSIPIHCSLAVDSQGNLYLFVSEDSTILKFDSNGKQIGKWSASIPGITPGYSYGIAVDKQGDIFLNSNTFLAKINLPKQ